MAKPKTKKVGPFYIFLTDLQKLHRQKCGRHLSMSDATELASEQWPFIPEEQKEEYRRRAEEKTKEIKTALRPEEEDEAVKVLSTPQLCVENFLACFRRNRCLLMRTGFIVVSMNAASGESWGTYPSEICFAKWTIVEGVTQVYHVYLNPNSDTGVHVASSRTEKALADREACLDLEVIAKEIVCFIESPTIVMGRGNTLVQMESCLEYIFKGTGLQRPRILDQAMVVQQIIFDDTANKKLTRQMIVEKFPFKTGEGQIKMHIGGDHTGIRCSWHQNSVFCAGRRAVEDAFIMVKEIATNYRSPMKVGQHSPIQGKLIPEFPHRCSRQISICEFLMYHQGSGPDPEGQEGSVQPQAY